MAVLCASHVSQYLSISFSYFLIKIITITLICLAMFNDLMNKNKITIIIKYKIQINQFLAQDRK